MSSKDCGKESQLLKLTLGLLWEAYYTADSDLEHWERRRIEFNAAADRFLKCRQEAGDVVDIPGSKMLDGKLKVRLTPEESDNLLVDDRKPRLSPAQSDDLLVDEVQPKPRQDVVIDETEYLILNEARIKKMSEMLIQAGKDLEKESSSILKNFEENHKQ